MGKAGKCKINQVIYNVWLILIDITRQHSSRMRTDRAVTRSSSERVSSRAAMDGQTPVKTLPSLAVGNERLTYISQSQY